MKTIEVTDEMYNSLMELSKDMTTQDNLCTSMPHMFQVRTIEKCAAYEGQGTEVWVNEEGDTLDNEEEIREFVQEYIYENEEYLRELDDDEAKLKSVNRVLSMDQSDLEEYLEENTNRNWWKVNETTREKYQNTFFTAKACKEHIEVNDYHYRKPTCYLNHAFRNPEMELVSRFLCELSGGKLHR